MLEIIRNDTGIILGACEWRFVNDKGQFDSNGKYIWVHDIEVSKPYRNNGVVRKIIKSIFIKAKDFEYVYFTRSKYSNRMRIYPRHRWFRLIKEQI